MIRRAALLIAVAAVALMPVPAVSSPEQSVIFTGPGAYASTYHPPVAVAFKGSPLTYVNGDLQPHDVVSVETGPSGQPWCAEYPAGKCPLFWSELIFVGRTTPVLGIENVVPGTVYQFYCSIHPGMFGRLVALPGL